MDLNKHNNQGCADLLPSHFLVNTSRIYKYYQNRDIKKGYLKRMADVSSVQFNNE